MLQDCLVPALGCQTKLSRSCAAASATLKTREESNILGHRLVNLRWTPAPQTLNVDRCPRAPASTESRFAGSRRRVIEGRMGLAPLGALRRGAVGAAHGNQRICRFAYYGQLFAIDT